MKILITGAAGFIGSNLCKFFLNKDFEVIGLDNFATGFEHNLISFFDNLNFKFIEGDICSVKTIQNATKGVDFILHQAALGSVPRSIKDPIKSNEVNVSGFLNLLEASKKNKVKRIIYASSSSIYGDSNVLPKTEENIGNPLSPYAITKYINELYADVYAKTYGIELIGLRYFNVFGKKQTPEGAYAAVIPKFISQFLNGKSPVINGDGSNTRDFTYIDNILQINLLALKTKNPKAINQVYNAAVGERITILKMAEQIRDRLSIYKKEIRKIPIHFGPNRPGDIPHSLASIEKAKKLLGYKPSHNFKEGIEASVEWYLNNIQ